MMLLRVDDIHSGYGEIQVLHGVSLSLEAGEILGVLGRNGMGKTTLIRCIAGLLSPRKVRSRSTSTTLLAFQRMSALAAGSRRWCKGEACSRGSRSPRTSRWGGSPAAAQAQSHQAGPRLFPSSGRATLPDRRHDERRRAANAGDRPRSHDASAPDLLDEPSDGIMPVLVQQIAEIIVRINREDKMAIIVVEQNVPMVFAMTSRCVIIEKGRIVAEGTREAVSQSEVMREYLGHLVARCGLAVQGRLIPFKGGPHADRSAQCRQVMDIADNFGLELTADDAQSFVGLLAGIKASYDRLDALVEPRLEVRIRVRRAGSLTQRKIPTTPGPSGRRSRAPRAGCSPERGRR